jgi:hypothetical protein
VHVYSLANCGCLGTSLTRILAAMFPFVEPSVSHPYLLRLARTKLARVL